jgi:4-amino-4-deoxy-L-arabinose transferase-like glycosyltransferase
MALCLVRGVRRRSRWWLWAGCALVAVALPVKAPVVLALAVPAAVVVAGDLRSRFVLRQLPALILPLLAFALWQWHVDRVNRSAPDWFFIPDYHKMVDEWRWYFGTWQQRLMLDHWLTIAARLWHGVGGTIVALPAMAGVCLAAGRGRRLLLWWLGGALLTVIVFFNLNLHHDYYQIPWLGPVAAVAAVGLVWLARILHQRRLPAAVVVAAVLVAFAGTSVRYAETHYYRVITALVEAGEVLNRETPASALLVVSAGALDCRNPQLLYGARRYGWSIPGRSLSPALVARLRGIGATHLAVVTAGPLPASVASVAPGLRWRAVPLGAGRATVHLTELSGP